MDTTEPNTDPLAIRRATLRDVAQMAGCSTAAVSTVINRANGRSTPGPELAKRIQQAARELGYRPHFASRVLLRNSAETIGVFLPPNPRSTPGYSYMTQLLFGIEQGCQQHAFDLLAINLGGNVDPKACGHKFSEGRIDGLVMLQVTKNEQWVSELVKQHPCIVAVNYHANVDEVSTLNFDDAAATGMAVAHLASLGHRRIAYIGTSHDRGVGAVKRCEGYRRALAEHRLPICEDWVFDYSSPPIKAMSDAAKAAGQDDEGTRSPFSSFEFYGAYVAEQIVAMGAQRPTGIVTYADGMAIGAMHRLSELGVKVPGEVSIVGLDDAPICRMARPQLTTIRQPLEQMGRQAAELVIKAAERTRRGVGHRPVHVIASPELVVRDSTAPVMDEAAS